MKFPQLVGLNLEEKAIRIPSDLEGKYNLLIIPFKRWQQDLVDQWVPFLEKLSKEISLFKFYEVPTLSKGYKIMRFMIDEGMRAGIPDNEVRKRTKTTYIQKGAFLKQLNIKTEDTIHLFLSDKEGNGSWKGKEGFSPELAEELVNKLINLVQKGKQPN